MTNKHWTSVYEFVISLTPSKQIVLSGRGVHIFCQIKGSWYEHGGLESTEIQKKMPGFVTHIFWLGMPQGSQKCPYGNIPSISWRENSIFQIYVLKIDPNLIGKKAF